MSSRAALLAVFEKVVAHVIEFARPTSQQAGAWVLCAAIVEGKARFGVFCEAPVPRFDVGGGGGGCS
tara:strand:+ start:478 stop:678 length:201 start_codon:yes stop_codon:yes gene_type:complete